MHKCIIYLEALCAGLLEDTELLAKLSAGDMVALEAKYHTKCLVGLYNRARKAKAKGLKSTDEEEQELPLQSW